MFVDRIKIFAQAGNGGRGCVSFRREKFVPKGGPDGGDGGRGGDVVLRANQHVDNLTGLFYEPIVKAKNGGHGMGKKMHGRSAPAKIVKVPVGTLVRRTEEGKRPTFNAQRPTPNAEAHDAGSDQFAIANPQSEIDLVVDLTRDGQEFVLCRGGAGGKGNVHFKSSRNRAPREYTEGEEGEQGHFLLELRTIADAGLVGYPNAGKSMLREAKDAIRSKTSKISGAKSIFTIRYCRSVRGSPWRIKWICPARMKICWRCKKDSPPWSLRRSRPQPVKGSMPSKQNWNNG